VLRRILNLDPAAFRHEVRTLLLNSGVVDDPEATPIRDGDILVVSGAMPGLVGAMLRSGSPIRSMRATISGARDAGAGPVIPGHFTLKAFNTVLRDHLADILRYGVYVEAPRG